MELLGSSSSSTFLSDREIEVCDILINIKKLIHFNILPLNLNWMPKKLRSRRKFIPNPSPLRHIRIPWPRTSEEREAKLEEEVESPNSPLCFSHSHKVSKKRKREVLLERIEGFEENRKRLRGALEAVKNHHSKLLALNLELKKTREKLQIDRNRNQEQTQLHYVDNHQLSNTQSAAQLKQVTPIISPTDSCYQMSAKAPLQFDLNEVYIPLEGCDME